LASFRRPPGRALCVYSPAQAVTDFIRPDSATGNGPKIEILGCASVLPPERPGIDAGPAPPPQLADPRMERLWSPAGATSGNQWQIALPRKAPKQAKSVAVRCEWLPRASNGKEGVDGSSPSEGSAKAPQTGLFLSIELLPAQRAVGVELEMELSRRKVRFRHVPSARNARLDTGAYAAPMSNLNGPARRPPTASPLPA
jgi:hypothetical protein